MSHSMCPSMPISIRYPHEEGYWAYSVTQFGCQCNLRWQSSSAEISIIRTINIHILMNFMIKMIDLIDVIPYMTVMSDDWYFSIWQSSMSQEFHWQLSNWVGPFLLDFRPVYFWQELCSFKVVIFQTHTWSV